MNSQEDKDRQLVDAALQVRKNAHAPYSGFRVGAALLDDRGDIHTGCNVENAAYPEGVCAEANAIGAMVAAGGRRIVAIAAVGGADGIEACSPCGGCRQRISEFADEHTRVILVDADESTSSHSIGELLPSSFSLDR